MQPSVTSTPAPLVLTLREGLTLAVLYVLFAGESVGRCFRPSRRCSAGVFRPLAHCAASARDFLKFLISELAGASPAPLPRRKNMKRLLPLWLGLVAFAA